MKYPHKYQSGNVFPLLLVILALIGIVAATNMVDIPQIFKSRADFVPPVQTTTPKEASLNCGEVGGTVCPSGYTCQMNERYPGYPEAGGVCIKAVEAVTASCDTPGKVSLKWASIAGSTNYTLRINHYPSDWDPDYTQSDSEVLTSGASGDRALEAGNNLSKTVNVGEGFYLGGTVTSTNGTVQAIPEFNCPKKYESCVQSVATACAPDNSVFCRQFPNPCKVPPGWNQTGPTIKPSVGPKLCIQVITSACEDANPTSCKDFPTPCDVPAGWTKK